MIVELAVFEREPPETVRLTEADILRDAFGSIPACEILIADLLGACVGFALLHANYSTWEGRAGLHIEDLYVREAVRGRGVGRKLVAAVAALADARGCPRVELNMLHWNPAASFYERLGMQPLHEWRRYRLDGKRLAQLAAESGPAPGPKRD